MIDPSIFLKVIFENAHATSILILDPKGTILDVNYGFQLNFGYTHTDLIGKHFSLLFTQKDNRGELPEWEIHNVLENGISSDDNYIVSKEGKKIWVHGESILVKDDKGEKLIVKILQDINKEKLLQNELIEKNKILNKLVQDRDTFVYTTSHDLQAPLNNIEGLINILEKKYPEIKSSVSLMQMIHDSIEKFKSKIKELSAIGKAQEEVRHSTSGIAMNDIYNEILSELHQEIDQSKANITADFSEAPSIKLSAKNLRSILYNLISNAIKYRSPGRLPEIKLCTKKLENDYVMLIIRDNGLGIKEEDKDKIFKMYGRAHDHVAGTGVGMAIVKRIVDNAGGLIEVESEIGKGTTFTVCV